MSLLPLVRVSLDKKLPDQECEKIHQEISSMKGVLGAHFNERAKEIMVTYDGDIRTKNKISKIKGVNSVRNQM